VYEPKCNDKPLELVLEAKYGKIVDYKHYMDKYLVIAFTNGYITHLSTEL